MNEWKKWIQNTYLKTLTDEFILETYRGKWILKNNLKTTECWRYGLNSGISEQDILAGFCKHNNECTVYKVLLRNILR
jgi:hypothetical protein